MPITLDYSRDSLISPYAKTLLGKHYFQPGETSPQDSFVRAALAYSGGDDALAQRIYEYASKQFFMWASPVLSNAPKPKEPWKALPASCFLNFIPDTREGIVEARSEVAWLTFMGGGVGSHVSGIRAAGPKSNGPIPFLKVMDTQMLSDRQANVRRGSIAFYMDISHVDVMEFISSKDPSGGTGDADRKLLNSFPAINVTDDFIFAVKNDSDWHFRCPHTKEIKGTTKAREVWRRLMDYRRRTGVPYLCFVDTANRKMPQEYKDLGLYINGSNLCCVTGDQLVPVFGEGMWRAIDLYHAGVTKQVFGSSGVVHTKTPMKLVAEAQPIYKIETKAGFTHRVTGCHKIPTQRGLVEAKDLVEGDSVILGQTQSFSGPATNKEIAAALVAGFHTGDGTSSDSDIYIDLWEGKTDKSATELEEAVALLLDDVNNPHHNTKLKPRFNESVDINGNKKLRLSSRELKRALINLGYEKNVVPEFVWKGAHSVVTTYLRGVFATDGHFQANEKSKTVTIALASVDKNFLQDIQLLLLNLGVMSRIYNQRTGGDTLLPDGKGGSKIYKTQDCYRLYVSSRAGCRKLNDLISLSEYRKGATVDYAISEMYKDKLRNDQKFSTKVSGVYIDGVEDVYCWEVEAEDHLWVCNGLLTKNSEIFIPTSSERTAVCVLSSVNLEKWDEWKDHPTFIQDLITMLDNVVEKFIENCPPQLHKAKMGALRGRDIGLGAMGLHSLFQSKGIPFGSLAAKMLNKQIFKHIWENADKQTRQLAIERGPAPDSRDKRNVLMIAIAPNSNNSVIVGTSASIEPWMDNAFIRDMRVGQELVKNKYLEQLLESKGKNTPEVWKSIISNEGSIIHLPFLTNEEKEVFKTAFEIDQRWIVELAADRQEYVDQGQSLNLFFDSNSSNKLMSDVHLLAWEKGLKSLYYLRSKAASRPDIGSTEERVALGSNQSDSSCLSCEG
jgi:ribonucleoside-diphosphate reductase alpha chain